MESAMAKHNGNDDILEDGLKKVYEVVKQFDGKDLDLIILKVSEEMRIKRYDAARRIYRLKEHGLLDFIDPDPPKTLKRYFFSTYCIWFWLVFSSVFLVLILIYVLPSSPPFVYFRYVFGSVFVLYLPGASLMELLYPKPGEMSQLERLALSIGLSLALVPLVGLVLNYTPWGIRLGPVFSSLSLLTIGLASGASYRKFTIFKLRTHTAIKGGAEAI
jgi:hypothetical protein